MKLIKGDLLISVLTVLIPVIFQLVFIWYASNFIDKSDYGIFIIVNGLILALGQVLTSMPIQVVNRYYNACEEKIDFINEMRTLSYSLSVMSVFIFFISATFYGKYFSTKLMLFCAIYVFINVSTTIFQQIFLIKLNRVEYFKVKVIDGISKFAAPIFGYVILPKFDGIIFGAIVGQLLSFLYLEIKLCIYPRAVVFNFEKIKKYLKFSYPVLFSSLASWIIVFSDRLFIEHFLGVDDVAWYSLLVQLAGFAQILNVLYTIYVTPTVLKVYERSSVEGIALLASYLKKFSIALLALFIIFLFIPLETFEIILGENFFTVNERDHVLILVVASVFLTVYQTAQSLYFVLFKKLQTHAFMFSLCAFINFILNFYIEKYGVIAAAVSTLISYFFLNTLIIFWMKCVKEK